MDAIELNKTWGDKTWGVRNSPSAAPLVVALAEGTQRAPCKLSTNVFARSTGSHVLLLKTALKAYIYKAGVSAGTPNLEGLALAPTTPTALARHGLQASCRRLRLLGALSQRARWRD